MSPEKVKAQELYDKFFKIIKGRQKLVRSLEVEKRIFGDKAKKSAIFAILMLENEKYLTSEKVVFWEEVKRQLKRL